MRAWHVARHFGVRQSISDAFLTFVPFFSVSLSPFLGGIGRFSRCSADYQHLLDCCSRFVHSGNRCVDGSPFRDSPQGG